MFEFLGTTECLNLGEQPFVFDCQTLADALEDLYRMLIHPVSLTRNSRTYNLSLAESFLAPPQTSTEFYIDTCAFSFLNFDTEEYSVCYLNFVRPSFTSSFLPNFSLFGGFYFWGSH